jgi:hypothetical protein
MTNMLEVLGLIPSTTEKAKKKKNKTTTKKFCSSKTLRKIMGEGHDSSNRGWKKGRKAGRDEGRVRGREKERREK